MPEWAHFNTDRHESSLAPRLHHRKESGHRTQECTTTLNIYLTFDDNCREVFAFHRSVFGGEFSTLQTFGDGPPDMGVPDDAKHRIMHVSLPVGDSVLMGSDANPAFGPGPVAGTNFSISYTPTSRADADITFAALAAGGKVSMPMAGMFWGSYFGSCTDQFGIGWQINWALPPSD